MSRATAPVQICDHEDGCDQWAFDIAATGGRYVNPEADPLYAWQIDRVQDVAYCPDHKALGRCPMTPDVNARAVGVLGRAVDWDFIELFAGTLDDPSPHSTPNALMAHIVAHLRAAGLLADPDALGRAKAEELREFATYLDGGTPRAWGFHHPCDPPGQRWEPSEEERERMANADIARDRADRIDPDRGDVDGEGER